MYEQCLYYYLFYMYIFSNLVFIKMSTKTKPLQNILGTGKCEPSRLLIKKHRASHHMKFQPIYLYIHDKIPSLVQWCDKILAQEIMKKTWVDICRTDGSTSIFRPGLKYSYNKLGG